MAYQNDFTPSVMAPGVMGSEAQWNTQPVMTLELSISCRYVTKD